MSAQSTPQTIPCNIEWSPSTRPEKRIRVEPASPLPFHVAVAASYSGVRTVMLPPRESPLGPLPEEPTELPVVMEYPALANAAVLDLKHGEMPYLDLAALSALPPVVTRPSEIQSKDDPVFLGPLSPAPVPSAPSTVPNWAELNLPPFPAEAPMPFSVPVVDEKHGAKRKAPAMTRIKCADAACHMKAHVREKHPAFIVWCPMHARPLVSTAVHTQVIRDQCNVRAAVSTGVTRVAAK